MFKFLKKIASPFTRIKSLLGQKIKNLFLGGYNEGACEHLEQLLYEADLGAELAASIVEDVKSFSRKNKTANSEEILAFVKERILSLFQTTPTRTTARPHIILVVGVNGSGKTTTLAKLAKQFVDQGKKVLIAAGDTFRAAAVEQLETWAIRVGADLIKAQPKGDPSAVAYDALQAALARKVDLVLIDTAGRLQNKTDLMHELAKIRRVIQKLIPDAPHETLLVLDATIGQNALDQANTFHQFTPITGIVLSKLDGTARGGIAVAVHKQLNIPILWAGLGEGAEDLIPFDAKEYVDALFNSTL
jgi:fused signal recognition particle receptor